MVLLFLSNGSRMEVPLGVDAIHQSGYVVCLDGLGCPIASFPAREILGYSLNPALLRTVTARRSERRGRRRAHYDWRDWEDLYVRDKRERRNGHGEG